MLIYALISSQIISTRNCMDLTRPKFHLKQHKLENNPKWSDSTSIQFAPLRKWVQTWSFLPNLFGSLFFCWDYIICLLSWYQHLCTRLHMFLLRVISLFFPYVLGKIKYNSLYPPYEGRMVSILFFKVKRRCPNRIGTSHRSIRPELAGKSPWE